jgi:hypothetical protein
MGQPFGLSATATRHQLHARHFGTYHVLGSVAPHAEAALASPWRRILQCKPRATFMRLGVFLMLEHSPAANRNDDRRCSQACDPFRGFVGLSGVWSGEGSLATAGTPTPDRVCSRAIIIPRGLISAQTVPGVVGNPNSLLWLCSRWPGQPIVLFQADNSACVQSSRFSAYEEDQSL